MSQAAVDLLLRGYRAFVAGDLDAIEGMLDPEVEWLGVGNVAGMARRDDVLECDPCPSGDIRKYYSTLWSRLSFSGKDALHLATAAEFIWPTNGLGECTNVPASDIRKEIGFLFYNSEVGIAPFHGSLLAFVSELQEHDDRVVALLPRVAQWLEQNENVETVNYPGLTSSTYHKLAKKYLHNGFGAVLSFTMKGTKENTAALVDQLKLVSHLANVGDAKTLIIQPSATTHQQLSNEEQITAGVLPNLLRVSVGIEHIDDIKADFEQAFTKVFEKELIK